MQRIFIKDGLCYAFRVLFGCYGGAGRAGGCTGEGGKGGARDCLFWMDPIGMVIRYSHTEGPLRAFVSMSEKDFDDFNERYS